MKALVCTLVACALLATRAWSQIDIGQISGTVVDNTKAVVPGVSISAINEEDNNIRTTTTNSSGYYTFPNLMVGTYTITAEANGFSKYSHTGIHLNAADQVDVSVQLSLGSITQTVEVTGSENQSLSLEPSTGGTVTATQFKQLEVNGRNPVYLGLLQPGVVGTDISTFDPDSVSNGSFAINGGRPDEYTVYVDGAMATRTRESGSMLGAQDMESLQEIQVLTGNFDAQYGRSNAGQIRFVTKSGTSQFHGEAYEVLRNSFFDANTWSRNSSPIPTLNSRPPQQNYNDFGYAFGGPFFYPGKFNQDRSKFFFFVAQEWVRRAYVDNTTGTVPTAAMRTGDLSYLLNPANTFFGKTRVATDPLTGKPFPGNIIPSGRLNQQGVAILNAYPMPTPGFQQGASNWIAEFPVASNVYKTTAKVDYYINAKNHLYARGTFIPWHFNNPLDDATTLGLYRSLWSRPNRTAIIDLATTFSPTFLNDFSISGNSDGKGSITADPACGPSCERSTYGLTYPYLYPGTKLFDQKLPNFAVTGLTSVDLGPYPGSWSGFVVDLTDNVTKVIKNHTIMFGGTAERAGQNDKIQLTSASAPQTENQNGAFQFLDTGTPNTTGLGIANALLGNFNNYAEFGSKPETPWVANALDLFAQDVWQVIPKLSLHYGLRYSIWPAWGTTNGTLAQFDPAFYNASQAAIVSPSTGFITSGSPYNGMVLPGSGPTADALKRYPFLSQYQSLYHNLPAGFIPTQWSLVQPRFGAAYEINSNTVIRVGLGYFADRTAINRDTALGGNPPFMPQTAILNANIDNLTGAGSVVVPFTMTVNSRSNVWPTAWEYNATVQRQLRQRISLSAGYVGNRGIHLQLKRNINQLLTPGTVYAYPTINPNALRPYVGAGIIDVSENSGLSWYNGLQARANSTSGPVTYSVSYTLSKSLDDTSILTDVLPNAYDKHSYWGRSDFNVTQALIFSYIYNLPFHGNSLANAFIAHWTLSGINQFESGVPFSVRENIDYAGIGPGSGNQFWNITGKTSGCRTSFILHKGATLYCKSAFTAPALGSFATGLNRNVFTQPGFLEWNLAVHKQFPVYEQATLEFRAEAFNLLNHSNWSTVDSTPTDAAFMQVTSKTGNRNLQFTLKLAF